MANNLSDYLDTTVLTTYFTNDATLKLGLCTADPGKSDVPANEISGGAYARTAVTFGAPTANGTAKRVATSADVTFPQATADWGTITHAFVINGAGHVLTSGPLTTGKTINATDIFQVLAGSLTVDLD